MAYKINYKSFPPYGDWHHEISSLKEFVESKCFVIDKEYKSKLESIKNALDKEYAKGWEYGQIFEQHDDNSFEVKEHYNIELLGLENHILSTLETLMKRIASEYKISVKPLGGRGTVLSHIDEIVRVKEVNMLNFSEELSEIDEMRRSRNDSQHKITPLERFIDSKYILRKMNSVYVYMDRLIQELYQRG